MPDFLPLHKIATEGYQRPSSDYSVGEALTLYSTACHMILNVMWHAVLINEQHDHSYLITVACVEV